MIIVRRVRHKRSALFSLDNKRRRESNFRRDKKYRHIRDARKMSRLREERAFARQLADRRHSEWLEAKYQKELGIDPWDEPFERKIDPRANSSPSSYQRLLSAGVEPDSPPPPQPPGSQSTKKPLPKASNSKPDSPPPPQPPGSQSTKKPLPKASNSKALLAGLALAGVVGAAGTGAYFIRRRRSKKGKIIVERVRR